MGQIISILAAVSNQITRPKLKHVIDRFEGYASGIILFVYVFIIVYGVITRQVTSPPVWGQDIVIGLFIWLSWLSTAYAVRTNSHLRFTLLFQRLSPKGIYAVYVVEWIMWFAFAGVILWYSLEPTSQVIETGTLVVGLPIPVWLFRLSIPVGFTLILMRVVQQAVIKTRAFRKGKPLQSDMGIGDQNDD
jgi:TRAP-type C4-dicarboxylate transport system permease small subunit